MSMITASAWVPRGCPAPFPTRYDIDDKELARISRLAKLQLEDAKEDLEEIENGEANATRLGNESEPELQNGNASSKPKKEVADDDLREYDLDHYDSDPVDDDGEKVTMFGNAKSLAYHESNADDPYITLRENEEDDEEREELQVLATDNMLVAAKVEDEVAHLEVYIYEDEADNLYVHHDIMLPAIPLCVEWLDIPVGQAVMDQSARGNFVAVGTFDPDIEIWDLDTVDCMYPNTILGQGGRDGKTEGDVGKKKKKRKKSKKANDDYHVDAILSLAANRNHRTLLASSSADKTVKLWDVSAAKCAKSYSYHHDKVCTVAWNPKESTVLLSGSYDRTIVAADMRAPDAKAPRWAVESDVEKVQWNPHDAHYFFVTTEKGVIHYHDARSAPTTPEASNPIWTLQAHDESVSSFDINPHIPGFLVTGGTDKEVKLWNVQSSGPSMVVSRNLDVGKVFTTTFAPDVAVSFRLAVAGSKGTMQIWDTSTNIAVRRAFADRLPPTDEVVEEKTIGIDEDSSESEEEVEDEAGGDRENAANGWESMDED